MTILHLNMKLLATENRMIMELVKQIAFGHQRCNYKSANPMWISPTETMFLLTLEDSSRLIERGHSSLQLQHVLFKTFYPVRKEVSLHVGSNMLLTQNCTPQLEKSHTSSSTLTPDNFWQFLNIQPTLGAGGFFNLIMFKRKSHRVRN